MEILKGDVKMSESATLLDYALRTAIGATIVSVIGFLLFVFKEHYKRRKGGQFVGAIVNPIQNDKATSVEITDWDKISFDSDMAGKIVSCSEVHQIGLPMRYSSLSQEPERNRTLNVLRKLNVKNGSNVIIEFTDLPVTAGLIIGYALHTRNNVRLVYETSRGRYENTSDKVIEFDSDTKDKRNTKREKMDLCFYIHAKSNNVGSSVFCDYINGSTLNPYIVSLMDVQIYDISFNFEKTAEQLVSKIERYYEQFESQYGARNITVHLFYNGIFELALSLGNKLSQQIKIQLYDHSSAMYQKSFLLQGELFSKKVVLESEE